MSLIEDRILRLEQYIDKLFRARTGIQVIPGKNVLGQDTEIKGDLHIAGDNGFSAILTAGAGPAANRTLTTPDQDGTLAVVGDLAAYTRFVPLTTPLTSTAWDGDARSTTAKTPIDLSAEFGVPDGVKAVLVRIQVWDSASGAATSNWMGVSPNNTAGSLAVVARCAGLPNDVRGDNNGICPCDANGDIYFQNAASGSLTQGSDMQIWGYWL